MMLLKCYTEYANKFGKLSSGHRTGKHQFPIPKKGDAKECSNYSTTALISHASKIMLIILQAGLDDSEVGIKIAGRNINNLRYVIQLQKVKRN